MNPFVKNVIMAVIALVVSFVVSQIPDLAQYEEMINGAVLVVVLWFGGKAGLIVAEKARSFLA